MATISYYYSVRYRIICSFLVFWDRIDVLSDPFSFNSSSFNYCSRLRLLVISLLVCIRLSNARHWLTRTCTCTIILISWAPSLYRWTFEYSSPLVSSRQDRSITSCEISQTRLDSTLLIIIHSILTSTIAKYSYSTGWSLVVCSASRDRAPITSSLILKSETHFSQISLLLLFFPLNFLFS